MSRSDHIPIVPCCASLSRGHSGLTTTTQTLIAHLPAKVFRVHSFTNTFLSFIHSNSKTTSPAKPPAKVFAQDGVEYGVSMATCPILCIQWATNLNSRVNISTSLLWHQNECVQRDKSPQSAESWFSVLLMNLTFSIQDIKSVIQSHWTDFLLTVKTHGNMEISTE